MCHLYQNADATIATTMPDNARFVACTASSYTAQAEPGGAQHMTCYRHAFVLAADATGGFTLDMRSRQMIDDCRNCTQLARNDLPAPDATRAADVSSTH